MHNLIASSDLSKTEIIQILNSAQKFKNGLKKETLKNKIIASCFFESSTRTRLSFEAAILSLEGKVIGFSDSSSLSLGAKGESLNDTLKIIGNYADGIIIRHPLEGTATLASELCSCPIINAGDGANQHPTQTLVDLFSILDTQKELENINLGIMGDLKFSRTVHSLIEVASLFNMRLFFIASPHLRIDSNQLTKLKKSGTQYSFYNNLDDVIENLDCIYMTRLQKERQNNHNINAEYSINLNLLKNVKSNFKILHPLPRLSELPKEIDDTKYAYYFEQASNGVPVRMALLDFIFSKV